MLRHLSIRNVILIDKLDMELQAGLVAFTGETGAGKSILLDALGLAIGKRGDSGIIRNGQKLATISAEFDLPKAHEARRLLEEQGIESGDTLILRRQIGEDGRSRAFINEEPTSISFLKTVGAQLVEIEGQFETHGLLDAATHLFHLDAFAGLTAKRRAQEKLYGAWRGASEACRLAELECQQAEKEQEYLRHSLSELELAQPLADEESILSEERALLAQAGQMVEGLESAMAELGGESGADRAIAIASRKIDRWREVENFESILAALDRASIEVDEAMRNIEMARRAIAGDGGRLERVEERLYLLRDLARKHRVAVVELPDYYHRLQAQIDKIDRGSQDLKRLHAVEREAKATYVAAAAELSLMRAKAVEKMDQQVNRELPALKLEKAKFFTRIEKLPEVEWSPYGHDKIQFEVSTNPGSTPAAIDKIASGGELARFMLALKVTLNQESSVPTLVFDEVDTGIGGATAAAVGERLKRLGKQCQVLVVTHSPQVAAIANHHWLVQKSGKNEMRTDLLNLTKAQRQEEIARMLSGAEITKEARAAANKLLKGALPV